MACFTGSLLSQALGIKTTVSVVLPNDRATRPAGGFPVLYLLHGQMGDYSSWLSNSRIEQYAADRGIAVVMPEVLLSYYSDKKYGLDYFSYMSEDLPRLACEMFGLSGRREDTFVAGLSMGGYGALKCALSRPDIFSAGAALSGAVNIHSIVESVKTFNAIMKKEILGVFGDPTVIGESDDLFMLAGRAGQLPPGQQPRILTCCGTEDFLYEDNLAFAKHLTSAGLEHRCETGPGSHDWDFWNEWLIPVLDFFMEPRKGNENRPVKKAAPFAH